MFTERTSVGLDVHARSVAAAAIGGVTGELFQSRLSPSYDSLGERPRLVAVVEELAEIETLTERQVFSPFSVPPPNGVAPQFINTARGTESAPPSRITSADHRPVVDPATTATTHQQRQAWAEATGSGA